MPFKDRWAPRHDYHKLDLAFIVDCTGSMGEYIRQAQKHVISISETISRTAYNVRLALVEYRDHPPQDKSFVTRVHDFTSDVKEMKVWVDKMSASGGGDCPESVADAIFKACKLGYREDATKMCVLIADAPPHGLGFAHDGFPNGCPDNHDPLASCHVMAEKGITLYTIGCEPSVDSFRDFLVGMAAITGGQYVPLHSANVMSKMIIDGALEEVSLEKLMGYVDDFVQMEIFRRKQEQKQVAVGNLAESLNKYLNLNNNRCQQLRLGEKTLDVSSNNSEKYSSMKSMKQARELFKKSKNQAKGLTEVKGAQPEIAEDQTISFFQAKRLLRKSLSRQKIPVTHDEIENQIVICFQQMAL